MFLFKIYLRLIKDTLIKENKRCKREKLFRRDDLDSSLKKFLRNFIVPIRYKLIKTIPPVKLTKRCMKNLGDHYKNHPVYINRKVASNCTSGNAFD